MATIARTPSTTPNPIGADMLGEIVRRIVQTAKPKKVILFGSRARGDARSDSDLDLLVIAESTEPRYRRSAPLYGALSDILLPMDIIVFSPEEVKEWSEVPQAFVTTAIREGKVLYEN
jgi:predicted nucleotidyltransferase